MNYQYVNSYTVPDVTPLTCINEIIHQVGRAKYISVFDATAGYHQCLVKADHQWLTGFVSGSDFYEFTRVPFGMRSSGSTFVRAAKQVLEPVNEFTCSYVDDMAAGSQSWSSHLRHLDLYLSTVRDAGMTLNVKKLQLAKREVKLVGHIVGSGKRRADTDKIQAVLSLKVPQTKKQVRQVLGFFGHYRDYLRNFAEIAKPLTDLTGSRVSNRIPWSEMHQTAFDQLKQMMCDATMQPLHVIDCSKRFSLSVDASDYAVGAVLAQPVDGSVEQPVAFASCKLNHTQQNWATIEKEAYAAIWALQKFRHWLFGSSSIDLYSDHNPLEYLTMGSPRSAKLMRWLLALQEFNVCFKYRLGHLNCIPDCLSRMVFYGDNSSGELSH